MSKMGDLYLEMTEDAQSMTLSEFVTKWGSSNEKAWYDSQDPHYFDYYNYPEPEYD